MYAVKSKEQYEYEIYHDYCEHILNVYINNTLLDGDAIASIKYTDGVLDGKNLSLGSAVIPQIEMKINKDAITSDISNKEFRIEQKVYKDVKLDKFIKSHFNGANVTEYSCDVPSEIAKFGYYYFKTNTLSALPNEKLNIMSIAGNIYGSADLTKMVCNKNSINKYIVGSSLNEEESNLLQRCLDANIVLTIVDETIPLGFFYVSDVDESSDNYVIVKLKGKMKDLDEPFDSASIVKDKNIDRRGIINAICNKYNLYLATPNFINNDVKVETYDNSITARTWLTNISERAGGFAQIGRVKNSSGRLPLYIKSYGETDKVTIPNTTLGEYNNKDMIKISKISYSNGVATYENGDDTGSTIYLSSNNILGCSQQEIDNIANSLNGLQIQSLKARIWGDSSIDSGDIITIGDLKTIAQKDWEYKNGWIGYYDTQFEETTSSLKVEKINPNTERRLVRTEINDTSLKIKAIEEDYVKESSVVAQLNVAIEDGQGIIDLKGNSVTIESDYFTLDKNGKITATSGDIGGFNLGESELEADLSTPYTYTQADATRIREIIVAEQSGYIPTQSELDKYDLSRTGKVNSSDYQFVNGILNGRYTGNGKYVLDTSNSLQALQIKRDSEIVTNIGIFGSYYNTLTATTFYSNYINVNNGKALISSDGDITCHTLTQTSLESEKKNFEKYSNALDEIKKIDIYKYNYKNEHDDDKKHIGFIIGEEFNYSKEITSKDNDKVDLYSMVSLCLQAIKEQQKEIDELKRIIKESEE